MWQMETWFSGEHVSAGLVVGLDILEVFSNFKDSVILYPK